MCNKYQKAFDDIRYHLEFGDDYNQNSIEILKELVSRSDCVIRNETVPLSDEEFIDRYEDLLNQGYCEDCNELNCLTFNTPKELVKIFRRYQYVVNKLCKELAHAYPCGVNDYGTNCWPESWKEWAFKEEKTKEENKER